MTRLMQYLAATMAARWHQLSTQDDAERGDSPVPTVIIIAGLAILAAAVVFWATTKANDFMKSAPNP
jgi:hypothetical protein